MIQMQITRSLNLDTSVGGGGTFQITEQLEGIILANKCNYLPNAGIQIKTFMMDDTPNERLQ